MDEVLTWAQASSGVLVLTPPFHLVEGEAAQQRDSLLNREFRKCCDEQCGW